MRCDGNLRQALFHRELTRGFEDPQQCRDTTLRWLQDMLHDNRTHRELGRDLISLAKLVPLPFDEALRTLASRHGWPAEALMQAVVSITNWLEHHETVLREKADGPLSCTPPFLFLVGVLLRRAKHPSLDSRRRFSCGFVAPPPVGVPAGTRR